MFQTADARPAPALILASASPRRRELLQQAGYEFEVVEALGVEPGRNAGESCPDYARRIAEAKARAAAARHQGRLALGADTIVVLDDQVLGKPDDAAQAAAILARLSGRTHRVYTGVALATADAGGQVAALSRVAATAVRFKRLEPDRIADYVATGEPLDKAGAYGIQGLGATLVAGFDGSYSNVVGLPLETVAELLAEWGQAQP